MLKNKWKSVFRVDSAYFSEAVDLITENDAHFFIKAAMSESRQNFVQVSPALHWSAEIAGVSYVSYDAVTKNQTKYCEIYKRTRVQDEQ